MSVNRELGDNAPSATFAGRPMWRVWNEREATAALRAIFEHQGLNPAKYALHSGRIGGATRMASIGLSIYGIQGRWKSDAVGMWITSNVEAETRVSLVLASNAMGKSVQPGQRHT
ncbi:unnamed protein product, partial [Hapterophycus canaliculatus]